MVNLKQKDCLNTAPNETSYDLVIIGAGMSGSLLALSLLKKNAQLNILLVDENAKRDDPIKHFHPSFDARCIALNAGSVDILNDLSLWSDIQPDAQSIKQIQVSDKGYFNSLTLAPEIKGDAFGYVVELRRVGKVLAEALSQYPSLTTLYQVKLEAIEQSIDAVKCTLSNGEQVEAKLCIGADGSKSQVRQLANIKSSCDDYQRSAIICNIQSASCHQDIAYERFTQSGPIALLPLTDNRFSLVYCVEGDEADAIANLSDADFLMHLQQRFGYRAGIFTTTGKRDIYPLSLLKTSRPIAHRVVCIGNAAHSLHPVAGQGFNLGLRDVCVLAKVIAESDLNNIGSFSMLNKYWMYREKDHNQSIFMTDSLVRIFSNRDPLLSFPRNLSLQAMSLFPCLSMPIVEQAKGQFDLFRKESLS